MMLWFIISKFDGFRFILKSLKSLRLGNFYTECDETEEESEENDDNIDYDQFPTAQKLKVITFENNLSNIFYIMNELVFNGESLSDEVRQRI